MFDLIGTYFLGIADGNTAYTNVRTVSVYDPNFETISLAVTLSDHDRIASHTILRPSLVCSNFSFNDTYNPDSGLI